MADIPDIKTDLPMSMTMAAFCGISWYVGAEINASLFLRFKRRRGLYFWACALGSWGVILQPLFIILADFGVWRHLTGSITMIYLTWLIMVVPQSWVLYSRLHLIMQQETVLRWIQWVLIFNSIVFSVPTITIGILAQATSVNPNLFHINTIWDRLQLIVFFVQETSLSILYIYQARKFLRDSALLHKSYSSSSALTPTATAPSLGPVGSGGRNSRSQNHHHHASDGDNNKTNQVLHHLIYTNILIIALDITLLGIQCADLFYLQGAFKPCVYGVKLKIEFVILNRLIKSLRSSSHHISEPSSNNNNAYNDSHGTHPPPLGGSGPGPNYHASVSAAGQHGGGRSRGGFWSRHSRTRSGGGGDGGDGVSGGGPAEGDQVWLEPLDGGKGSRLRSHESQSPILDRGIHSVEDLPARGGGGGYESVV